MTERRIKWTLDPTGAVAEMSAFPQRSPFKQTFELHIDDDHVGYIQRMRGEWEFHMLGEHGVIDTLEAKSLGRAKREAVEMYDRIMQPQTPPVIPSHQDNRLEKTKVLER